MSRAKIITLTSEKGGIGKTFTAYNYAVYLSMIRNKKVLLFDLDSQKNDTLMVQSKVDPTTLKNSSIFRAFVHFAKNPTKPLPSNFKPFSINSNLDMFAGSNHMNKVDEIMSDKQNMEDFVLMRVIISLELLQKYDYIIIDTHNSFTDATINALIVADYILVPTIPNLYSMVAVKTLTDNLDSLRDKYIDMKTGKSHINGKLYFIGNMIKFNTKASHQFEDVIKNDPSFIASFMNRELVNKATNAKESIFKYAMGNKKNEDIISKEVIPQFEKITRVVNK